MLALSFRRVNADDRNTLLRKLFIPALVPRVIANAVDSAKGPKVEDHNLSAQIGQLKRLGIEPSFFRLVCQLRRLGLEDGWLLRVSRARREHRRHESD